LLTALREIPAQDRRQNPVFKRPRAECRLSKRGNITMKNFIILTAFAVLTVGSAIAAMPGAASSTHASAARNDSQPIVMTAELELPFDRYWSKN
jgi:hypothetical protein